MYLDRDNIFLASLCWQTLSSLDFLRQWRAQIHGVMREFLLFGVPDLLKPKHFYATIKSTGMYVDRDIIFLVSSCLKTMSSFDFLCLCGTQILRGMSFFCYFTFVIPWRYCLGTWQHVVFSWTHFLVYFFWRPGPILTFSTFFVSYTSLRCLGVQDLSSPSHS